MANRQYIIDNTDRTNANEFTVPGDEDGGVGELSFDVDSGSGSVSQDWYIHITNNWDVEMNCRVEGSHFKDEDMTYAVADGPDINVLSNNSTYITGTTNHSWVQLRFMPEGTPTTGKLIVTAQTREN
jgi:hypothetical protein